MRVLIDANVLLDVMERREPHYEASSLVWKLCEVGHVDGCFSALTFANLVYILRKQLTPEEVREVWKKLRLIFSVADLTEADLETAAAAGWNDFEDAVQSAVAGSVGADFIITRNKKDYAESRTKAVTPAEFLTLYEGGVGDARS